MYRFLPPILTWFAVMALPLGAQGTRALGDLDQDGVATVRDIALIAGHFNGTATLNELQRQYADVNKDGAINDADMDELVKVILGTRTPETLPLAGIRSVSPAAGEGDVAVTRETVVNFTIPLAAGTTLDTTKFRAEFGGKKILSRVELSSDRKKATLFYLEPLPSNARIRGELETAGLSDLLGRPVDGDGDGQAGGVFRFSFDTLSITPVATTAIVGRVIASERATGGLETPLAGVTVTVDGAEQTLRAVTDAQGNFMLNPCPAGTFFVKIDGRTSPLSSWPGGDYYPEVGKKWHALAGRTDNLAGGISDTVRGTIYLPLIRDDTLKPVSSSQTTMIRFPAEVLAANPALAGTEIQVPANSLFSDSGVRGGKVGIAPVAPDRLPSPLPPGLNLPMVITIQTDGATNFDRPVPVSFPNLPDPVTGEKLPPGAKSALWSFNHDIGEWTIAGPMTVSEDGLSVRSDPGTGVRQPGWHGQRPAGPVEIEPPVDAPPPPDFCDNPPPPAGNNAYKLQFNCLREKICALRNANPQDQPRFPEFLMQEMSNSGYQSMRQTIQYNSWGDLVPRFEDTFAELWYRGNWHFEYELRPGFEAYAEKVFSSPNWQEEVSRWRREHNQFLNGIVNPCIEEVFNDFGEFGLDNATVHQLGLGVDDQARSLREEIIEKHLKRRGFQDPAQPQPLAKAPRVPRDLSFFELQCSKNPSELKVGEEFEIKIMVRGTGDTFNPNEGDFLISPNFYSVRFVGNSIFVTPVRLPFKASAGNSADTLLFYNPLGFGVLNLQISDVDSDQDGLADGYEKSYKLDPLVAKSWDVDSDHDGIGDMDELFMRMNPFKYDSDEDGITDLDELHKFGLGAALNPTLPFLPHAKGRYLIALRDVQTGVVQLREVYNRPAIFILPPNASYDVYSWSLEDFRFVKMEFGTGSWFDPKLLRMIQSEATYFDSDLDGLPDLLEQLLGLEIDNADTDDDGITDRDELLYGSYFKKVSEAFPGIVAGSPTVSAAFNIAASNNLACVAMGQTGVSIFNVASGLNPTRILDVDTPGNAVAVACAGTYVCVADDQAGLAIIDVGDPANIRLARQIAFGASATAVASDGITAYVGTGNGRVVAVDLASGLILSNLPTGGSAVEDMCLAGDMLYLLDASTLRVFNSANGVPQAAGSIGVSLQRGNMSLKFRLFCDGKTAYCTHSRGYEIVNVENPAALQLVRSHSDNQFGWKQMVANGSGLGIAVSSPNSTPDGPHDIDLYNVGADGRQTNFITTIVTPGLARAVSLYNGFAYVADSEAGLQVINYLAFDSQGQPPSISLSSNFNLAGGTAEEGKRMRLSAAVADDVQVRNVEFYVNGKLTATDGNYPFECAFLTPALNEGSGTFTVRAKATDTGGNFTWTDEITLTLTPDATPPVIVSHSPSVNSLVGAIGEAWVKFNEPMSAASLAGGITVNGASGTSVSYRESTNTAFITFASPLSPGAYQLKIATSVRDAAGNALASPVTVPFRVFALTDNDADGLADDWESLLGLNSGVADSDGNGIRDGDEDADGDGLTNGLEILAGTNPSLADTDGDGLPDGLEDSDLDGLTDGRELVLGTDRFRPDTDDDGWTDEAEVTAGSNPLDSRSRPYPFLIQPTELTALHIGRAGQGLLTTVASRPAVTAAKLAAGGSSGGLIRATPDVTAVRLGGAESALAAGGTLRATPDITVLRFGSAGSGSSSGPAVGQGVILAIPPVTVSRPFDAWFAGSGAVLQAQPPIRAQRQP